MGVVEWGERGRDSVDRVVRSRSRWRILYWILGIGYDILDRKL